MQLQQAIKHIQTFKLVMNEYTSYKCFFFKVKVYSLGESKSLFIPFLLLKLKVVFLQGLVVALQLTHMNK